MQRIEGQKRRNENTLLFMWWKPPELLITVSDERLEEYSSEFVECHYNQQVIRVLILILEIFGVCDNARTIATASIKRCLRLYRKDRRNEE